MFVVALTYVKPLEEVEKHLAAHIAYLKTYYASGEFIGSGRKVPRTGGVILVHAENRDAVDKIVAEDPFSIAGVADYEITEFVMTMSADALKAYQA